MHHIGVCVFVMDTEKMNAVDIFTIAVTLEESKLTYRVRVTFAVTVAFPIPRTLLLIRRPSLPYAFLAVVFPILVVRGSPDPVEVVVAVAVLGAIWRKEVGNDWPDETAVPSWH